MKFQMNLLRGLLLLLLVVMTRPAAAQEESEFKDPTSAVWFNTYGIIRVSKRFFWDAQTHFRFEETPDVPFIGQIGQIYNRHAIGYIYSKKFNVSPASNINGSAK